MIKQIGGRGYKAQFPTIVRRVPEALNKEIDDLIEVLYEQVSRDEPIKSEFLPSLEMAMIHCKVILKSKKSAKISLQNLLRILYNSENITL